MRTFPFFIQRHLTLFFLSHSHLKIHEPNADSVKWHTKSKKTRFDNKQKDFRHWRVIRMLFGERGWCHCHTSHVTFFFYWLVKDLTGKTPPSTVNFLQLRSCWACFHIFFSVSHKVRDTKRGRKGEGLPGWEKYGQMQKDDGFPETQEKWEFRSLQLTDTRTEKSMSWGRVSVMTSTHGRLKNGQSHYRFCT